MKKKIYSFLYYVSIIIAVGSAAYIGWYYYEMYRSDQDIEKIQELVRVNPDETNQETINAGIDFNSLKEINKDAIGWIQIEDTKVDYPVVQGKDNDYYLTHNIFKKYDRQGAVFMDYRNDMNDDNLILYAHNMKNGNMFADVAKYKNVEQIKTHPTLKFLMHDLEMEFAVIGAFFYDTKIVDYQYLRQNFTDEERTEYTKFLNQRNIYGNISFEAEDQLMTLSTCNYYSKGDRFVLILKRIS